MVGGSLISYADDDTVTIFSGDSWTQVEESTIGWITIN